MLMRSIILAVVVVALSHEGVSESLPGAKRPRSIIQVHSNPSVTIPAQAKSVTSGASSAPSPIGSKNPSLPQPSVRRVKINRRVPPQEERKPVVGVQQFERSSGSPPRVSNQQQRQISLSERISRPPAPGTGTRQRVPIIRTLLDRRPLPIEKKRPLSSAPPKSQQSPLAKPTTKTTTLAHSNANKEIDASSDNHKTVTRYSTSYSSSSSNLPDGPVHNDNKVNVKRSPEVQPSPRYRTAVNFGTPEEQSSSRNLPSTNERGSSSQSNTPSPGSRSHSSPFLRIHSKNVAQARRGSNVSGAPSSAQASMPSTDSNRMPYRYGTQAVGLGDKLSSMSTGARGSGPNLRASLASPRRQPVRGSKQRKEDETTPRYPNSGSESFAHPIPMAPKQEKPEIVESQSSIVRLAPSSFRSIRPSQRLRGNSRLQPKPSQPEIPTKENSDQKLLLVNGGNSNKNAADNVGPSSVPVYVTLRKKDGTKVKVPALFTPDTNVASKFKDSGNPAVVPVDKVVNLDKINEETKTTSAAAEKADQKLILVNAPGANSAEIKRIAPDSVPVFVTLRKKDGTKVKVPAVFTPSTANVDSLNSTTDKVVVSVKKEVNLKDIGKPSKANKSTGPVPIPNFLQSILDGIRGLESSSPPRATVAPTHKKKPVVVNASSSAPGNKVNPFSDSLLPLQPDEAEKIRRKHRNSRGRFIRKTYSVSVQDSPSEKSEEGDGSRSVSTSNSYSVSVEGAQPRLDLSMILPKDTEDANSFAKPSVVAAATAPPTTTTRKSYLVEIPSEDPNEIDSIQEMQPVIDEIIKTISKGSERFRNELTFMAEDNVETMRKRIEQTAEKVSDVAATSYRGALQTRDAMTRVLEKTMDNLGNFVSSAMQDTVKTAMITAESMGKFIQDLNSNTIDGILKQGESLRQLFVTALDDLNSASNRTASIMNRVVKKNADTIIDGIL